MLSLDRGGMTVGAIIKESVRDFLDDDMTSYASALAYQALFSLFPFVLFLLALIGFLKLPDFFSWLQQQAAMLLPIDAMEQVNAVIDQIKKSEGGLLSVGILLAIWTASGGVRSTMNALNIAYDVHEGRATWKVYLLSILYTVALAILLLLAAGLMITGPEVVGWVARQVGLENLFITVWTWSRWPIAILLMVLTVAIIYYVAPDVEQDFRFITPGSIIAVMVWIAASIGFGTYVSNFADYNATYGSIGAIIVLLLYFYISAAVLLFGAEVNSVIEHHSPEGKNPGEKEIPGSAS